jgi:hypothetical protein
MSESGKATLTFQQLSELRRRTEIVSKFLQEQLAAYLETLRPILAPDRVLGKYLGARGDTSLSERAFMQLQQAYKPFTTRPFELPAELDPHWLTLVGSRITLYPWEYAHEARTDRETRTIAMTSPVRWIVSYSSPYTLSQFRQAVAGTGERRIEHVRQFVVNALVVQLVTAHSPGLAPLFADLRYHLQTDAAPDLPRLPLTTITASLPSFRPADDLILSATSFSGVPAFIELIDLDAFARLEDPLRTRVEQLLR